MTRRPKPRPKTGPNFLGQIPNGTAMARNPETAKRDAALRALKRALGEHLLDPTPNTLEEAEGPIVASRALRSK